MRGALIAGFSVAACSFSITHFGLCDTRTADPLVVELEVSLTLVFTLILTVFPIAVVIMVFGLVLLVAFLARRNRVRQPVGSDSFEAPERRPGREVRFPLVRRGTAWSAGADRKIRRTCIRPVDARVEARPGE